MAPLPLYPIQKEKDAAYLKELRMQTRTFDPIKILERAFQETLESNTKKTYIELSLPLLRAGSALLLVRLPQQAAAIATIYETTIKNLTHLEPSTRDKISILKKEIALLEQTPKHVDWPDEQLELLLRQIEEKKAALDNLELDLDIEELEEIVDLRV